MTMANDYDRIQEAAEPRKIYSSQPDTPDFAALLPAAGDPVFETDAQSNDEFYCYDTDVPRDVDDTGQPSYTEDD